MLAFRDLRVRSLDLGTAELSWALGETTEDPFDYRIVVLRSESPEGPFERLGEARADATSFLDDQLQVAHRWRTYFYRLRLHHVPSGREAELGPVAKEPEADLVAVELRRHMNLLLREFTGRRAWLFPVRTAGPRCTCWNAPLAQRRRSGCVTCFDTGFLHGYLAPIETWVQMEPSPKGDRVLPTGPTQPVNTSARLGYYPSVKPRDLLVEGENRRWKVVEQRAVEHGRAAVFQEVLLHEVPPKDIEFAVPLQMDTVLRNLWLSPPRNFTNPTRLGAAGPEGDPLSLYPPGRAR
jgi:hypothetical protein